MEFNQLKNILEAALLAAQQPLSLARLGEIFSEDEGIARDELARALESLREDATGRGVELVEVASGFRYQVRRDVHPWVSRMWTERPSRYSRALLETLSLIAYRQPITRGEIEQIRGVAVSSNIVKTLEEREWIRVVGHRDVPGKPALFGTTRMFLDYFNLKSLDELPPLAEIRDLDDLDPQFDFDGESPPARAALPDDADAANDAAVDDTDADGDTPAEDTAGPDAGDSEDTGNHDADEAPTGTDDHPVDDSAGASAPDDVDDSKTDATADEAQATAESDDAPAPQDSEEKRA